MRPFSGGNDYSKNRISASPSKSYPTCSSLSSQTLSPRKSMEEVWKDINLPCLHDRPTTTLTNAGNHPAFPGMILQDFLGRPFSKDPSTTDHQHRPSSCVSHDRGNNDFLNSLLGPRPATMLSLNSASPDFQFLENTLFRKSNPPQLRSHRSSSSSLDALPSSSSSLRTKRAKAQSLDNSTDQRSKRMMKNRESAARSRARKQAYTQELELELSHLREENANLRRQQDKLQTVPVKLPKKKSLYRTLTAPF